MAHARPGRRTFRRLVVCLFAAALALPACRITDLRLWGPATPPPEAFAVERFWGLAYCDGPDAQPHRHQLDLFLPKGCKDFPVVVLVHGGAWVMGDNRCCGLHTSVGEFLASQGIGAVLPNYRLSPSVRHPEHVRDVARAVAWVKAHIAQYGGRPDQIFLAGHSAGGHLVALLGTDATYLEAEGLKTADIKGVMALSGVYQIPTGSLELTFGGATPRAFRIDEMFPIRGGSGRAWAPLPWVPGIPVRVDLFSPAFGDDPRGRADASPLSHVRPDLPPFLLFSAANDLPTLPPMAEAFCRALTEQGCEAQLVKVADRNHNSILFRAVAPDDPVARAMLEFIRRHAAGTGS